MQIFIGKLVAVIAEHFLRRHWQQLREALASEYSKHQREQEYIPSLMLQKLLISGEDHRYFQHPGFDLIAICRAIWRCLAWGVREGASTIEMQIVRVLTGRYEITLSRKIREILLATLVTRVIPKNEIPAIYIKIAYFGWRMNGFKQACKRLNLHHYSMSLEDSAALIARLKYPEPRIPPFKRLKQIINRRDHLIKLYRKHIKKDVYELLGGKVAYESI